jgi:tetratricopeptide (TPR) repeat protein
MYRICALLAVFSVHAFALPAPGWRLTRSPHFEIYSQAADETARSTALWLEQLRAFFLQQTGQTPANLPPVRVIGFRSTSEYRPYRLRPTSDGYFVGTGSRDYIVMVTMGVSEFHVAAHEYAHAILHAGGLQLPPWLNEGLAEFFSTIHIDERGITLGGEPPSNMSQLKYGAWMPLSELLTLPADSPVRDARETAGLFYAQSWALTEMLLLSPEYGPGFHTLLTALSAGTTSLKALATVYAKSTDTLASDVHAWVNNRNRFTPVPLPPLAAGKVQVEVSDVPEFSAQLILADLLLASGELERAEKLYGELARARPESADISAALGAIALRQGDSDRARQHWKHAIDQGVTDAMLCYRYAVLAGTAGLPADEIRPALQKALALNPDFDDARYTLALLEKNARHFEAALEQLHAISVIPPVRRYSYWTAIADACIELDKRDEAIAAAKKAAQHASTPAERALATQLAHMAQTDLAVGFSRDANGRPQMVTTRIPHNATNWNPFIEPGDDIRSVQGTLREIECGEKGMRILVDTTAGPLTLAIPDPTHVQMRNAPEEFTCGPQPGSPVTAEYAVTKAKENGDGVVRGLEFR